MGRLKNSINDLQTKIAGLRDKKKKMNPNNEEIENVKQQIKFNEFDTIRNMWQENIDESNIERGIMKKMRRGKVAKGMPR